MSIGRIRLPGTSAALAAAALLGGLIVGFAAPAEAALPDSLCAPSPGVTPLGHPSAEDLRRAAASAETRMARRGGSESGPELTAVLEVPAAGAAAPSPQAVAEYCVAAGEMMRISPQGSQLQAQTFLLSAFQKAQAAGMGATASVAAYRLGLVSVSAPSTAGVRGARGGRTRSSTVAATVQTAARVVGEGPCNLLLGGNLMFAANLTVSLASLGCSVEQAQAAGDHRTAALAGLRLARLRLTVAENDAREAPAHRALAHEAAITAMSSARHIDSPSLRAEVLGRLVSAALDARSGPAPELAAVIVALREADPHSAASRAFAVALDGRLALAAGDRTLARRHLTEALLHESQRSLPARLPEWRLLLAQADPAGRDAHVRAAYEALEAVRPMLPRFDPVTEETAFSLYMRQVFQSAVDVELSGAPEGAGEVIRVRAAQRIVEAYRQAELQSVFGSECIPVRDPLKPEALRAGEVLLYPILLPDRLEILYVAGGQGGAASSFRRLPPNRGVDRQAIGRLVERMVLPLSYDESEDWRDPARQLYDLLIRPIEHELKPGGLLVVVPDGPLRGVPFAALLDARDQFLVQKARLTVAPSLAYSQPGAAQENARFQLVAASLEREVRLPSGFFEKLEGTANEARIAAIADGQRIQRAYAIENFKKADLVGALQREQVDILHLATHATFNGRSDRAFIVADGEAILLSELRQLLAQNRTRGEDLDLLVLSACETAVGDDEASMGLAGAAVQAGARSAIASLWPVNDIGTAALMKNFYELYRRGLSKSAALRQAQLAMIDSGGMNANPNVWAAFTLLGAWR